MRSTFYSLLFSILLIVSCQKDADLPVPVQPAPAGMVKLELKNMVDTSLLYLDTVLYILDNGDKLRVSMYKYYISNVQLMRSDSTFFTESYSYHLVDQSQEATKSITIDSVPEGDYIGIRFMIGVDSAHNVSGTQSGDLDPAKGMFWAWNTGYIMAKLEGTSQQSTSPGNSVGLHIGGFKGAYSALKTVSPSFNGSHALVTTSHAPIIHVKCDLAEWFKNPAAFSFSSTSVVTTVGPNSKMIADNYADMFSVTGIYY
jgi:hypothetical protein